MPAFSYRAVDPAGKPQRGEIDAPHPAAVRQILRERNLLPLAVSPAKASATLRLGRRRLGAKHLATFTRQMATLIGSNITIEEALRIAAGQAETGPARAVLLEVRGAILDGHGFARALARYPDEFPEFYRASVAAGEQSGKLSDVLSHLAEFVESRRRNQQKVQLALLYPALLALVSLGMITMLLIYVVPDIVRVFVSRGTELPFLTRALIVLSHGVQVVGPYLLIGLAVAMVLARRWLAVPANRLRADQFLARTRLSRQYNAARFAGSLATLVQSAVPLVDAIRAAAAVTPNRHIRQQALHAEQRVREGASLRAAMAETGVFPPMLVAIVASGESSGRLGSALGRAAAELDHELDALSATLVGLVEPAVLLLMGGLVLLMVLAILLPIINLNTLVTL